MWNRENIEAQWAGWADRVERVMSVVRPYRHRLALFLAVVGPGLIVSNVDNDAGGIYTYAQSGAKYGNTVLWSLIPMTIVLYVSLEMCSRMGAVTGKGLSDLIREEFGFRVTFFLMAVVLIVNLGNVMAEFTGVFWASETFGVSRFIAVPLRCFRLSREARVAYRLATPSSAATDALHPDGSSVHTSSSVQRELRDYPGGVGGNDDRALATLLSASSGRGEKGWPAPIPHDAQRRADR